MPYDHGGDWAGFYAAHGALPLDFSANISPLGLPKGVRETVIRALDQADRYPDPLCRDLRKAIGNAWQVPPNWVLCGNGAGDLIERAVQAVRPRLALVTAPTFSEYPAALRRIGCAVREVFLHPEDQFRLTEEFLSEITPDVDMVFLCEPNNPTGVTTDPALLRQILDRCAVFGARLVVDECFNGLLPDPAAHTLVPYLKNLSLLILNAFTKLYAMPGLRLGFALSADTALLEAMGRCGQPWPVSNIAQAGGVAALADEGYPDRLRALLNKARPALRTGLAALGATAITGEANYLLFRHPDLTLADKLEEKGILLRRCAGYPGLGPNWYRAAVRREEENQRLLEAIRQVTQ